MTRRVSIYLVTGGAALVAGYHGNLAAAYIAMAAGGIFILLHAIEYKVNRLLDHVNIRVADSDISAD